jgi:short-subunit dehydrogenase
MKNVALITGGSTGVGYALAEQFAQHGQDLVLVSKNAAALKAASERLKNDYKVEVATFEADLRDETSAEAIYSFCREKKIQVETLVNNAGAGTYGPFAESSADDNEANVQIDIVTLIDLTYLFLHDMKERHSGYIMNVSSTAAFQPGPNLAVFYASKSFVLSFTEAIAVELEGSGVVVSCFCPGPVQSEFLEESGMDKSKVVKKFKPLDVRKAAKVAYVGLHKGKVVVIPGGKNKRRAFIVRFFSRKAVRNMMKRITSPIIDEK